MRVLNPYHLTDTVTIGTRGCIDLKMYSMQKADQWSRGREEGQEKAGLAEWNYIYEYNSEFNLSVYHKALI